MFLTLQTCSFIFFEKISKKKLFCRLVHLICRLVHFFADLFIILQTCSFLFKIAKNPVFKQYNYAKVFEPKILRIVLRCKKRESDETHFSA